MIGRGPKDWIWWFERRWWILGPFVIGSLLYSIIRDITGG